MLQAALERAVEVEPLERRLRDAVKAGKVHEGPVGDQVEAAIDAGVLTAAEARDLNDYHARIAELIAVDDFDTSEIGRVQRATSTVSRRTTKKSARGSAGKKKTTKTAARKKTSAKKTARKKTASVEADNGKEAG